MEKHFTENNGIKTEQINFRVTFDEKMLLTLMCPNGTVGDFLRGRVLTSVDNLKFCKQRRDQAKQNYEKFLSDVENMDYLDLANEYQEQFEDKWEIHYDTIKTIFNCEAEQDESGYLTNDTDLRQFLIGSVSEQMFYYYAYWNVQYRTAYTAVCEEQKQINQALSELKPE